MPFSMTGYGRCVDKHGNYTVTIELRSVNHRFLDISFRLPKNYLWLEEHCAKVLKGLFSRGKIDVFIQVKTNTEEGELQAKLNKSMLVQYLSGLNHVKKEYRIPGRISLSDLLRIPDLFTYAEPEEDEETVKELVLRGMKQAAQELLAMRKNEGEIVSRDLAERIVKLETEMKKIAAIAHELPGLYREKITQRLQELSPEAMEVIDEHRLAAEILLYVDRSAITEEIVRFQSHLRQFADTLEANEPIGRKLDFLTQELHREANTIAAKSSELTISHNVVEIKAEIEKIREQVQNIE